MTYWGGVYNDRVGCFTRILGASVLAALLLRPSAAAAEETLADPTPSYRYQEDGQLELLVPSALEVPAELRWWGLGADGRRTRETGKRRLALVRGANRVLLKVGRGSGHILEYRLGGQLHRLVANRGNWYAGPTQVAVQQTSTPAGLGSGLCRAADLLVARGFTARVLAGHKRAGLELGRTLGDEGGHGVRVGAQAAVVLIARGSVGSVLLTLGQRVAASKLEYWDYALTLEPQFRRYVIPLPLFHARVPPQKALSAILSVSMRATAPAAEGDVVDVEYIGFTDQSVRLRATRVGAMVQLAVSGTARGAKTQVTLADRQAYRRIVAPGRGGQARVEDPAARRAWVCTAPEAERARAVCDPPDAPQSSYALLSEGREPVVVDDFSTRTPVNAFRQPITVFGATIPLELAMEVERRPSGLRIRYFPSTPKDYLGYFTPLPAELPKGLESLELKVRAKLPLDAVEIGLRDRTNREPKVILATYAEPAADGWVRALIPLEAFRAGLSELGGPPRLLALRRVSLIMLFAGRLVTHEVELGRVQFVPARAPLAVARFDGEPADKTALGGVIVVEGRHGARIGYRRHRSGQKGQGLAVEVRSVGEKGYALVGLGLGRVNVRGYRTLTFWVRGERGGEDVALYLNDGRRRARVLLSSQVTLTQSWQRVSVPLAPLARQVDLSALKQVVIAWEDRLIERETLFFDEFTFE